MSTAVAEVSGSVYGRTAPVPHTGGRGRHGGRTPTCSPHLVTVSGTASGRASHTLPCPRGYRRDHHVSTPVAGGRWPVGGGREAAGHLSRPQPAADTSMATDTRLATCAGHQPSGRLPSGRQSFQKQRTVNPPIALTRYNFLCSPSRPALRAAACGGRPRPAATVAADAASSNGTPSATRATMYSTQVGSERFSRVRPSWRTLSLGIEGTWQRVVVTRPNHRVQAGSQGVRWTAGYG
jgi:hypothetical protein